MKQVWIILVNYNGYKDTIDCINSLKKVNYEDFKIVIVDNCSINDSYNKLKIYENDQIILLRNKKNTGFAGGCNYGIKYALKNKADYIMLLNNDTEVDENFLSELVYTMENSKNTAMVGGKIYYYNSKKLWFANGSYNNFSCKVKHYIKETSEVENTNFLTGCLQLIDAKIFYKVGLLNEKYFMYYEDVEFCNRLVEAGYNLKYNPKAIIYHKCGQSSDYKSANAQYYSNRARYIFIKEHYNKIAMFILYFELFIKFIIYHDDRRKGLKMLIEYIKNN